MSSFFINFLISKDVFDENNWNMNLVINKNYPETKKHTDTSKTIPLVSEILNPKNIKIAQRESLNVGNTSARSY